MKLSKEQFERELLILANRIGLKKNFEALMENYKGLPKIVEMIVYELFLYDYINYFENNIDVFDAYYHLKDYCKELREFGYVTFKN